MEKEKKNIFNKVEKIITNSMISFGLIILILVWSIIPTLWIKILGIDENTLSSTIKVMLSFINDLL